MSSYYLDLKYLKLLSSRLPNFRQKKDDVFAFSHDCEDFGKSRVQRRGNFFKFDNKLMFHCYHCSVSSPFGPFLRNTDPNLFSQYRMELFKDNVGNKSKSTKESFLFPKTKEEKEEKLESKLDKSIIMLPSLPENNPVLDYVKKRKIPQCYYDKIGVVADFYEFASKYDSVFSGLNKTHPRLVFPFYDSDGSIICYSCRSFGDEKPKYITLMVDKSRPKLYGLWKVDTTRDIYVVEGQIDSMFIDNCIAINGSDYDQKFLIEHKDKIIVIPDSDWKRNKHIFKSLENVIDKGFRVSLLPDSLPYKDINDCVIHGIKPEKLMEIIKSNITSGIKAKVEIMMRRK